MVIKLPDKKTNPDPNKSTELPNDQQPSAVQQQIDAIAASVSEMGKSRVDAEAAAKAKADEEVAAQLEAEADLKALMTSGSEAEEAKSKQDKINDLSNTDLIDVIGTSVETAINARMEQASKQIDEKMKKTVDAIDNLGKVLGRMQATAGIDKARTTHPDFDKFKDDTLAVLKRYPMMDIEDAYLLARQLRTSQSPPAGELETERPLNTPFGQVAERPGLQPASESTAAGREEAPKGASGIVKFRDLVSKAADKIIDARA